MIHLPRGSKVDTASETKKALNGEDRKIIIQPAPVYLDNHLIGEILFDAIDSQLNANASLSLYMKGARG